MVDSFCCAAIDMAKIASAKADDVVAVLQFGRANELPDDRLADEGEVAPPFDLAPCSHPTDLMVGVVPGVFEAFGHGPRRARVEIGRRSLPERLLRALFIVVSAELVEAGLLLFGVGGRRLRGLFLQPAMDAFSPDSPAQVKRRDSPDRRDHPLWQART